MNVLTQYQENIAFRPDRFNPVVLAESERVKVLLVCLEPGQFIPSHKPKVDLTLVVLEGKGTFTAGEEEKEVGPGSVAFVQAGEARGLKAETKLVAVHVVAPPPTAEDHKEVMAGLR